MKSPFSYRGVMHGMDDRRELVFSRESMVFRGSLGVEVIGG